MPTLERHSSNDESSARHDWRVRGSAHADGLARVWPSGFHGKWVWNTRESGKAWASTKIGIGREREREQLSRAHKHFSACPRACVSQFVKRPLAVNTKICRHKHPDLLRRKKRAQIAAVLATDV